MMMTLSIEYWLRTHMHMNRFGTKYKNQNPIMIIILKRTNVSCRMKTLRKITNDCTPNTEKVKRTHLFQVTHGQFTRFYLGRSFCCCLYRSFLTCCCLSVVLSYVYIKKHSSFTVPSFCCKPLGRSKVINI